MNRLLRLVANDRQRNIAFFFAIDRSRDVAWRVNCFTIDRGDHVAGSHTRFCRWTIVSHRRHQHTLTTRDAEVIGELLREFHRAHADPAAITKTYPKVAILTKQIATIDERTFPLEGLRIHAFPFPKPRATGQDLVGEALVGAFTDRCRHFLLRTATAKTHLHTLVRSHLGNQPVELANTRDVLAVDTQDHVVFAQTRFLCRTVFDHLRYTDAADLVHVIAGHVFATDVFRIDTKEAAAVDEN